MFPVSRPHLGAALPEKWKRKVVQWRLEGSAALLPSSSGAAMSLGGRGMGEPDRETPHGSARDEAGLAFSTCTSIVYLILTLALQGHNISLMKKQDSKKSSNSSKGPEALS